MADPIVPESPSLVTKTAGAVETAATFVGRAAKGAVESVASDAKTVVATDASIGARAEAGLNLVADAASFITGPEDAAIERAGVFAVKESVEHAPQLAEAGVALAKEGIENAPRIAEVVGSAFERTKGLLEKGGHKILESNVVKGLLETKNALYHTVEDGASANYSEIRSTLLTASDKGKNFAVHAEHLSEEAVSHLEKQLTSKTIGDRGVKTAVATTESAIEKSIVDLEHGHALKQGFKKVQELADDVTKPFETGKKLLEVGGKTLKWGAVALGAAGGAEKLHEAENAIGHAASEAVHRAEHAVGNIGEHISTTARSVEDTAAHAVRGGEHLASEAANHLTSSAKSIADDVKTWSPSMPFEQFEKLMNHVRGSTPPPAHDPSITRAPARQQQGVER